MTGPQGVCRLAQIRDGGADWRSAVVLDVQPHRPAAAEPVAREPLTARQQQILDYIGRYIDVHGYPPSIREIGRGVGLKSLHGVNYQLGRLADLGVLERPEGGCRSRALRLVRPGDVA